LQHAASLSPETLAINKTFLGENRNSLRARAAVGRLMPAGLLVSGSSGAVGHGPMHRRK
jgi:hypothetical protein